MKPSTNNSHNSQAGPLLQVLPLAGEGVQAGSLGPPAPPSPELPSSNSAVERVERCLSASAAVAPRQTWTWTASCGTCSCCAMLPSCSKTTSLKYTCCVSKI